MASTPKENILKKIRKALSQSTPIPFPEIESEQAVYQPQIEELEIEFAENFTKLLGIFSYCNNEQELVDQLNKLALKKQWNKLYCVEESIKQTLIQHGLQTIWHNDLTSCNASITDCEFLISRTGSIVMSSAKASGRTTSVYAPIHICIAYTNQLVYDIKDGLQLLTKKYTANLPSLITFATGPSRTADIEKTLVVGIHGPKEVYLFLVERGVEKPLVLK